MGEVIPFRPKSSTASPSRRFDDGPLSFDELVRVEELLTERRGRKLPTVFTNGGVADEPMLPCPLTDVSWLDVIDEDAS
jgi:hypothetical protein